MKRFLRPQRAERGATLTGYALLTAGLVVVSLGAIEGVNQSSQTVLNDTATSVGTPRDSVEVTKQAAVPAAPSWAVPPGAGYCSPGLDGCPVGIKVPVSDADLYMPPVISGDAAWAGSADNVDFNLVHVDLFGQIYLESVVQLNGEWTPPRGDSHGASKGTAEAGDLVCTYLIHTSPATIPGDTKFHMDLEFGGEVLGTSANSEFGVDALFESEGSTFPASNYVDPADEYEMEGGNKLKVHDFYTDPTDFDQVRVFTKC